MILNLGELAVRSRCSVQIQQDPLLIGYGQVDPTLQKEGIGRVPVFSKQHGEFQELVRYPKGRCLVGNLMDSRASLDVDLLVSKYSLTPIPLPQPHKQRLLPHPIVMGFSLRLALVYGMLGGGCGHRQRPYMCLCSLVIIMRKAYAEWHCPYSLALREQTLVQLTAWSQAQNIGNLKHKADLLGQVQPRSAQAQLTYMRVNASCC